MKVVYLHSDDYARRTGGWVYNSQVFKSLSLAPDKYSEVADFSVPVAFPSIGTAARARLGVLFSALTSDTVLLGDHLHIADLRGMLTSRPFRIVAIFHHAKAIEDAANGAPIDREKEQAGFDVCDAVIVSSAETRDYVASHYGFPTERVLVAVPGSDAVPRAVPARDGPLQLLSVGAVIPRKRYDYLIAALSKLSVPDWRWTIAGDVSRDPAYLVKLGQQVFAAGIADRVDFAGDIDDSVLEALWRKTSLYVAASFYEGYGMAVAEALRRGVPVVSTHSGAVATWARKGVIYAPSDDSCLFGAVVDGLLADPDALRRLGDEAWTFGQELPTWDQAFADLPARLRTALDCDAEGETALTA